jgi:hypothetical protein
VAASDGSPKFLFLGYIMEIIRDDISKADHWSHSNIDAARESERD